MVTQPETRTGLVQPAGGEETSHEDHASSLKLVCSYEEDHGRAEDRLDSREKAPMLTSPFGQDVQVTSSHQEKRANPRSQSPSCNAFLGQGKLCSFHWLQRVPNGFLRQRHLSHLHLDK